MKGNHQMTLHAQEVEEQEVPNYVIELMPIDALIRHANSLQKLRAKDAREIESLKKQVNEAKQAGRDEVMKELSEMEPEGYKFAVWDGRSYREVLAIDYIPQEHSVYGMEEIRGKDPLILRPTYKKGS
jgi:hypothetical protein